MIETKISRTDSTCVDSRVSSTLDVHLLFSLGLSSSSRPGCSHTSTWPFLPLFSPCGLPLLLLFIARHDTRSLARQPSVVSHTESNRTGPNRCTVRGKIRRRMATNVVDRKKGNARLRESAILFVEYTSRAFFYDDDDSLRAGQGKSNAADVTASDEHALSGRQRRPRRPRRKSDNDFLSRCVFGHDRPLTHSLCANNTGL